ncbi:transaldolase [Buchnera aphidicola]|uniref:Transaldolase n=1 Tax=Buchnera aphidicola (Therioaphis trifolii) TaxID=1241884 RepID=A0A4D6YPD8_9GAMM|nr:transaldolase [Buchnera aphidicola]QCI27075.1 transaldolase [Buchnera aphidicola (Therioaphis trifolii)]
MNQLNELKKITTIVADTGDVNEIKKYEPIDATTNPSLILQTMNISAYHNLIIDAVNYGKKIGNFIKDKITHASDKILVNIGKEILKYIPGKVSSEIDSRLSFNTELCILKAKKIINMYEDLGISRSRILIKLASTWECIQAAKELQKDDIHCNLTLLFSFAQAKACAESNVFLISPFVGRIYDWYYQNKLIKNYNSSTDPGVVSLKKIYKYYKQYGYKTIIMGASFRNIEQILELSGCDYLTISPIFLKQLKNNVGKVIRKLIPETIIKKPKYILNESEFRWEHNQDRMAVEKLSEGIRQFSNDQEKLEKILYSFF